LDNEAATVAECAIDEQGFVVLFVTKKAEAPKVAATPALAPPPAAAAETPAATPAAAPAATGPAAGAAAPTIAPDAAVADAGAAFGSLLTGSALETAVSNICEMGFPRDDVGLA
jgi:UV excision repair protein RAD23